MREWRVIHQDQIGDYRITTVALPFRGWDWDQSGYYQTSVFLRGNPEMSFYYDTEISAMKGHLKIRQLVRTIIGKERSER